MVLGRWKKEETRECAQESTDGVSKHFFLGVLNEDGTSKKTESSGRENSTRLESVLEDEKPMLARHYVMFCDLQYDCF